MTLQDAIRMMGTTGILPMESDQALATRITQGQAAIVASHPHLPSKAEIEPASEVQGNLRLRPISAMLELARGTVFNNDPDITAFSRRWSILRHLGIFAMCARTDELHLDDAALQFIGPNQRRVLSEDLGIGFGICVAKHWCKERNPKVGTITAIDVDMAIHNGTVPNLDPAGQRHPDYLLAYPDLVNPGMTVYELLETKGTVSKSTAKTQLGRAVTQLAGLTVGGQQLTGIAVSTVSNVDGFLAMAVDPEETPVTWRPNRVALERSRAAMARPQSREFKLDVPAEKLFAAATNVDSAALAAFCGQQTTAKSWLPKYSTGRFSGVDRQVERRTDAGTFLGSEYIIDIPGTRNQRVRIYQGVEKHVVDGLRDLDPSSVIEAQQAFAGTKASEIEESTSPMRESDGVSAAAVSTDGSMLEISVE